MTDESVLDVRGLRVEVPGARRSEGIALVHDVELSIGPGELVCLVGESGSGKTVTGQAVLGLARESGLRVSGTLHFQGRDLTGLKERDVRRLRGRDLALVPQEPSSALDPLFTIGAQMTEAVRRRDGRSGDVRARVLELLREARVPEPEQRLGQFPHELSGGLCQRVLIAMALAGRPRLIVADEPTSALDATVQLHLLDLLDRVRAESSTAILLITHDMGVAARADRIVVMYAGTIVEEGPAGRVIAAPRHPYTVGLLAATPRITLTGEQNAGPRRLATMPGGVPSPASRPGGCSFRTRCPLATVACEERPTLEPVDGDAERRAACWHTDATAAQIGNPAEGAGLWNPIEHRSAS